MNLDTATTVLQALAQSGRLTVVRTLVRAGEAGIAAGDLASAVGVAPNTMSVHLKQLQTAGLVRGAREGRSIRYCVCFDRLGELLRFLLEDCCADDPRVRACCGLQVPKS